jgi:predicted amidohydrolase YtcJ
VSESGRPAATAGTASTVVVGRIATLGGDEGFGWAEAIAVAEGRVLAAGRRTDVEALASGRTRRIELAPDEVAIPGLTDSHLHLAEAALAARRIDLADAPTLDAALGTITRRHASTPAGSWIEGKGWDADRWGRWPTADDLARVAPGRRIALWAHDHHALWASAAALDEAEIGSGTDDPPGGVIRRDETGRPTGVLHETAARLVTRHVPLATADGTADAVAALEPELVRLGIVAVHDPGGLSLDPSLDRAIAAYVRLAGSGRLRIGVHACIRPEQLEAAVDAGFRSGDDLGADGLVRAGWLKCFADGTLGSRTAALLEPLDPQPDEPPPPNDGFGVWMTEPGELADLAERAAAAGITTTIHAIGDAAVRASLDALATTVGRTRLVPRLEHIQLLAPEDLPRFAGEGIAASVQPVHLRSDAAKARRLWGPRAEARGYPFGSLARSGAMVCFGTDAPVEPIDPWPGLACAVTRAAAGWPASEPPFGRHESLALDRALRAQCVDPARSAGETDRGRLIAGHRADVVVVPAAALDEPVEPDGALWHARPRLVLIGGEVAFEA